MDGTLQRRGTTESLAALPLPERVLSSRDARLRQVIAAQSDRWPCEPTENPIWGLVRIVMAQQVSSQMASRLAERAVATYPALVAPSPAALPDISGLCALGLPEGRARCCVDIVCSADAIVRRVEQGQSWEEALSGIKGIGPWTISVFRIMVLRHQDVLPLNDVGLERALANLYGKRDGTLRSLGERWRPFRSVACWYLWRTLGNVQLG